MPGASLLEATFALTAIALGVALPIQPRLHRRVSTDRPAGAGDAVPRSLYAATALMIAILTARARLCQYELRTWRCLGLRATLDRR